MGPCLRRDDKWEVKALCSVRWERKEAVVEPALPPVVARARFRYFAGVLSVLAACPLGVAKPVYRCQSVIPRRSHADRRRNHSLARTGQLWQHVSVSAVEFAIGYVIASLLGIVAGLGMASSPSVKQAMQPWMVGLYATPTIALAPLFILWFGIGIWSKVLVVILLVFFPVAINTEAGLRTTSERLIEMLRSFGASEQQIFFKVRCHRRCLSSWRVSRSASDAG